jgi:hypothetical protein
VRLTMGGEPTFVSSIIRRRRMNTAAWELSSGDSRRSLSPFAQALRRARSRPFRPRQMVSGRELPRWSLNCFWRADGEPVWRHESLIAMSVARQCDGCHRRRVSRGVAERLGSTGAHIPGLRGQFISWASAGCRPTSILSIPARRSLERERLLRVFSQSQAGCRLCPPGDADAASGAGAADLVSRSEHAIWSPATRPWVIACRSTPAVGESHRLSVRIRRTPRRRFRPREPYRIRFQVAGTRSAEQATKREPCGEHRLRETAPSTLRRASRERVVDQPFGHVRGTEKRNSIFSCRRWNR